MPGTMLVLGWNRQFTEVTAKQKGQAKEISLGRGSVWREVPSQIRNSSSEVLHLCFDKPCGILMHSSLRTTALGRKIHDFPTCKSLSPLTWALHTQFHFIVPGDNNSLQGRDVLLKIMLAAVMNKPIISVAYHNRNEFLAHITVPHGHPFWQ